MPTPTPRANPDRVAKPVAAAVLLGVALAAVLRATADGVVDEQELAGLQRPLWEAFEAVVVPAVPALLAWLAARRARENVTPILTASGDQPRDLEGRDLHARPPAAEHTARLPDERPRVDRRGVDRDPDRPGTIP